MEQDWTPVVINRSKPTAGRRVATNDAIRNRGEVETVKKFGAGGNRQHDGPSNASKIDNETEDFHHKVVSQTQRLRIQQGRNAKGWSRSDLAKAINEREGVITDYETNAKCIPNNQILQKMEKALGVKLTGKL